MRTQCTFANESGWIRVNLEKGCKGGAQGVSLKEYEYKYIGSAGQTTKPYAGVNRLKDSSTDKVFVMELFQTGLACFDSDACALDWRKDVCNRLTY